MRATRNVKPAKSMTPEGKSTQGSTDHRIVPLFDAIWTSEQRPKWHPVRQMRYIFWRMASGSTITDAIREIHWHEMAFWSLVDKKRAGPFLIEYKRARTLQARAFSDAIVQIAEGRDPISRKHQRRLRKIITRGMGQIRGQKTALLAKQVLQSLLESIDGNAKGLIARNKLQIEAAKWIAKTASPAEFGEKASLALGAPDGDGGVSELAPLQIQFIGPDGKVVPL